MLNQWTEATSSGQRIISVSAVYGREPSVSRGESRTPGTLLEDSLRLPTDQEKEEVHSRGRSGYGGKTYGFSPYPLFPLVLKSSLYYFLYEGRPEPGAPVGVHLTGCRRKPS